VARKLTLTKLDPIRLQVILSALRAGFNREEAANEADLSKDTLERQLRKSRALRDAVTRAEIKGRTRVIAKIIKASDVHWGAAAWIAARRWPEIYGHQVMLRGTGPGGAIPVMSLEDAMLKGASLRMRGANGNGTPGTPTNGRTLSPEPPLDAPDPLAAIVAEGERAALAEIDPEDGDDAAVAPYPAPYPSGDRSGNGASSASSGFGIS